MNLDDNNDIEFDANAAMPDDDMDSDSDSDMPPSSDEEESSDEDGEKEQEAEEDEEDSDDDPNNKKNWKKTVEGDEGAPFGTHIHYKGEFSGSGNRWANKKAYKKRK